MTYSPTYFNNTLLRPEASEEELISSKEADESKIPLLTSGWSRSFIHDPPAYSSFEFTGYGGKGACSAASKLQWQVAIWLMKQSIAECVCVSARARRESNPTLDEFHVVTEISRSGPELDRIGRSIWPRYVDAQNRNCTSRERKINGETSTLLSCLFSADSASDNWREWSGSRWICVGGATYWRSRQYAF